VHHTYNARGQTQTMSETVESDAQGRITIPQTMREKYSGRFRILEVDDRIVLVPLCEDPVDGLQDATGEEFEAEPLQEDTLQITNTSEDQRQAETTGALDQ